MGDKTVEWSRFYQCDKCKNYGAYDFYGDFICEDCIKIAKKDLDYDDWYDENEDELWIEYNETGAVYDTDYDLFMEDKYNDYLFEQKGD